MKDFLKGRRTIISGWVTALAPAALMLGVDINPDAVIEWLKEVDRILAAAFAAGGAAVHYFRNLAGK